MVISIVMLVLWIIVGILIFVGKENPSKVDYGLVWICLIIQLISKLIMEWKR